MFSVLINSMNNELSKLIDKYLDGEANASEKELVDAWYLSFESHPGLTEKIGPEEAAKTMAAGFASLSGKLDLH